MTNATTTTTPDTTQAGHRTAWTRYRAAYSKLPPSLQMIGLQVWLPAVFVILFCFCYVFAFHSPTPKDVPVAVVGSSQVAAPFAASLEKGSDGALRVTALTSVTEARAEVRSGELAAAYVPGATSARLLVASGAQFQLASLAKEVFTPVAAQQKLTLVVDDLAPLPKGDSYGTALFYLTLLSTIGGYMVAMFVGLMGGPLRHRTRIGVIAGFSVLFPLISTLLVRYVLGVVDGHFFAIWATGAATAFAIGLVVNGLSYFFGRFVTGAALFLFVFLNVPASGGAFPAELVPQPFTFLHPFVSGTGTLDLLRHAIYGVGPGVGSGLLVLGAYAAAGVILTVLGRPYARRLARVRAARGAQPSMMAAAQGAAMALAAAAHAKPTAITDDASDDARAGAVTAEGETVGQIRTVAAPHPGHHHATEPYTVTVTAAEPVTVTVTVSQPHKLNAADAGASRGQHVAEHDLEEAEREMAIYRSAEVESDAVAAVTGVEA